MTRPSIFDSMQLRNLGTNESPALVAQDVLERLKLDASALDELDPDEKGARDGVQVVAEPGLYKLLFTSKTPEAWRFLGWVLGRVVPSVTTSGGFRDASGTMGGLRGPGLEG